IVLVLALAATIAFARRAATAATAVAVGLVALFVRLAEVPDWTLPLVVLAADFFMVGATAGRRGLAWAALLAGGLSAVLAIDPQDSHVTVLATLGTAGL